MTIGTKSVLFGAHQFLLHPFFLAAAWRRLYGFPWDPRLWVAFVVHDLGYLGKPNMDGPEGESHPVLGAFVMHLLFGQAWGDFTLLHSRYYARKLGRQPSALCAADKLAIALTPAWLYLPMVRATGEIHEYMAHAKHRGSENVHISETERRLVTSANGAAWFAGVQSYCQRWALEHRDGRADTWTPIVPKRAVRDTDGVWR